MQSLHMSHNGRGFRELRHKARFLCSSLLLMFFPER